MNDADRSSDELSVRTAELARAVRGGDSARFEELYARVAPALYTWIVLRAPRGIDPGDVLGETWLRALEHLSEHDAERHEFRPWVFGIAKNVLLHALRAHARRAVRPSAVKSAPLPSAWSALPDSVTSVSLRLATDEVVQSFLDHARALEPQDRDLVLYCAFEGLTLEDAGTRLGISRDAAAKRWQRLRADLSRAAWVRELLLL